MTNRYLENVKVLIVEDNPFMRTIIRRVLGQFGVRELREAGDGADAMDLMMSFIPDLVIIDWEMEPIDGLEFTRWIREGQDSPNPFMPIIMVSGHSEQGRVTQARDAGINEFLVKPLSAKSLMKRVQTVIEKPRPFVRTDNYFGPDRRRQDLPFKGQERRSDYDAKTNEQVEAEKRPGGKRTAGIKTQE